MQEKEEEEVVERRRGLKPGPAIEAISTFGNGLGEKKLTVDANSNP